MLALCKTAAYTTSRVGHMPMQRAACTHVASCAVVLRTEQLWACWQCAKLTPRRPCSLLHPPTRILHHFLQPVAPTHTHTAPLLAACCTYTHTAPILQPVAPTSILHHSLCFRFARLLAPRRSRAVLVYVHALCGQSSTQTSCLRQFWDWCVDVNVRRQSPAWLCPRLTYQSILPRRPGSWKGWGKWSWSCLKRSRRTPRVAS